MSLADETIRQPAHRHLRNRASFVTLIPASCLVAPDELTVDVCLEAIGKVREGLRAVGLPAVGTLDISFNEDREGEVEPHWCAHGAAIVLDWLTGDQQEALKALFPRSPLVSKPVEVVHLDLRENGRAYALKPDRFRRISYINRNKPDRKPFRDSRRRELRPDQAAIVANVEHQLGMKNRLITHRIGKNAIEAAFDGFFHPRDGP